MSIWEGEKGLALKLGIACSVIAVGVFAYAAIKEPMPSTTMVLPPSQLATKTDTDNSWYYVSNATRQCEKATEEMGPADTISNLQTLREPYTVHDTTDPETGTITQTEIDHTDNNGSWTQTFYRGKTGCQAVVDESQAEIDRHR